MCGGYDPAWRIGASGSRKHRPKGPRDIAIREEMRKRIVTRDHDVECALELPQIAKVAGRERNVQAKANGLQASAVQSSFTDVCPVDLVSVAGEAKCLGADPARAIKNGLSIRQPASDYAIKGNTLMFDRLVPVFVDEVVVRRQLVVEADYRHAQTLVLGLPCANSLKLRRRS